MGHGQPFGGGQGGGEVTFINNPETQRQRQSLRRKFSFSQKLDRDCLSIWIAPDLPFIVIIGYLKGCKMVNKKK